MNIADLLSGNKKSFSSEDFANIENNKLIILTIVRNCLDTFFTIKPAR